MSPSLPRRFVLAFAAAAVAALASAPARADAAAESYVAAILEEANPLFLQTDEAVRRAGIEALVDRHVDMRRVALNTLGQYARVISDAQRAEYLPLFRRYATTVYSDALSNYSGQRLVVTGSVDRTPRDIIVNARVADARPGDSLADMTVHWRVYRAEDGTQSIFDAGADGVWLGVEQQSQFKSIIANNGGGEKGIDALLATLREKVGG